MSHPGEQIDAFDARTRRAVLERIAAAREARFPEPGSNVNMHFHSFFSFNAEGYSPSHLAWRARKEGLYAAGLCDFDVLDGLAEFLDAGLLLGLRTTVNLETRAYLREYADEDINSPGEHGVTYVMGAGFARLPAAGTPQAAGLEGYRRRARERNVALVSRINARLPDIAVDYEKDVLPLTPSGAATERHIVRAYIARAREHFEHAEADAGFWAVTLGKPFEETVEVMSDAPAMEEAVRSKLVKRGGIGYEPPSPTTFPLVDEFLAWVRSCDAVPMTTWLDGTSGGEKDPRAMLECMASKGAAALNIIPDRNWNIADPKQRAVKTARLKEVVETAVGMEVPINIGTEMNRLGQPFADDLAGGSLKPYREAFLRGARIMVGHSLLLRYAAFPYTGAAAAAEFSGAAARNAFFAAVGGLPPTDRALAGRLEDMGPAKALAWFHDAAKSAQGAA